MKTLTKLTLALLLGTVCMIATGCGNVVPPGKKVILLHPNGETAVFDKGVYKRWDPRTQTYFVDQKLKGFSEPDMKILCADDINMEIDVKAVLAFDTSPNQLTFIKNRVPATPVDGGKELNLDKFYQMAVKDILRGTARNVISPYVTDDIRGNRKKIESDVQRIFCERVEALGYPLHVSAVLLSNIDYPKEVTDMRKRIKQAQLKDQEDAALAEATLAKKQRMVAIEQEDAKVRLVRAQAQADENTILTKSLTKPFLMWRQMEVLETTGERLAKGKNSTVFLMPYRAMTPDALNTSLLKSSIDGLSKK